MKEQLRGGQCAEVQMVNWKVGKGTDGSDHVTECLALHQALGDTEMNEKDMTHLLRKLPF